MNKNNLTILVAAISLISFGAACSKSSAPTNQPVVYNTNTNTSIPVEVDKMRETDPSGLTYEGAKNLNVTVAVTEQNTNFMVNYTLDGVTKTLPKGQVISFALKPDGSATNLQFNFRFSTKTNGKYEVVVSPVEGYPGALRPRTFKQQGSIPVIIDYTFLPK